MCVYIIFICTHLCIRVKEIIVYEKKNNLTLILTPHYRNVVIIPISIYMYTITYILIPNYIIYVYYYSNNIIYCMSMTARAICRYISPRMVRPRSTWGWESSLSLPPFPSPYSIINWVCVCVCINTYTAIILLLKPSVVHRPI